MLLWINSSGYFMPASASFLPPDKVEKLLKQGDKHFEDRFFYKATQFYEEALTLAPEHTYAHYQLAECYRNLFDYQQAKAHYEKVYQTDKEQYPLSCYYLALMFKFSGDYALSVEYFDLFISFAEKKKFQDKDIFLQHAGLEKEGSLYALSDAMKPKGEFGFTRLPAPVNTPYNDYAATVYHADSCIAFTSTRTDTKGSDLNEQYGEFFSDHYLFCRNGAGDWEDISKENNFSLLNTRFSEGTGAFNAEKNIFYFTGCYREGYCHIYQSALKNGKWQPPVPLNENVNIPEYSSKQPGISPGGDTLFFASNRPGGYGMQDIWMSIRSEDGIWQPAVNLGGGINTAQNELSPFYYASEKALFFSSNGRKGYGGYDIFMAALDADANTSVVINLNQPFNSPKDDLYLTLGTQKGFLSSNRGYADGNFDIYTFNITTSNVVLLALESGDTRPGFRTYFDMLRFFTKQDQRYYEQLPLEEKARVGHYIEVQAFREAIAEKAELEEDLLFFYEALSTEEKEIIDRFATAQKSFLRKENKDVLLAEDQQYYENLPTEKKEKIQKIIDARAFQKILQDETLSNQEYLLFYEALPVEDRERIDRAVAARKDFLEKSSQSQQNITLTPEDLFFYQALPAEEKEKIERMIAVKFFHKETAGNVEAKDSLVMVYEELPLEEKQRIDRFAQTRRFAGKRLEDDTKLPDEPRQNNLDIGSLTIGNPQNITIEGKITGNGTPAQSMKVSLTGGDKEQEKLVTTNQDGEFKFFNVNYHQNQQILFGRESLGFLQLAQYALEELKITVLQDTILERTFDNIYFETDKYTINNTGKIILDSLADFHFKYPDVQIEISAYADTVGSKAFNKQLSFKRASEAYDYLLNKGVDQTALHIYAKGKEALRAGKDLQYSRRVEFALQGIYTSYNPTKEVYVILPEPDLEKIAEKYSLSLTALMELNQNIKGKPKPFTPVRITGNKE